MADTVSESTWTGLLKNHKQEREWPARTRWHSPSATST